MIPATGPPSSLMTFPERLSLWVWPFLAGALAAFIYGLQHRMGIEINADGWAYWEGGQSIADGLGYRYFSGDPIVAWPPLYSLYLSAWIKLYGSGAAVLDHANILLIFLQGILWTSVYIELYGAESRSVVIIYVAAYIALTIPLYERQILAHNLTYTILPVFIIASWKKLNVCGRLGGLFTLITCGLGMLLVESHISGIVYVAAAAFLIAVFPDHCRLERAVAALAVLTIPLTTWILTAWWLAQIDGHPLEGGRFSFLETLLQMWNGIIDFVLPHLGRVFGLLALIVFSGALLKVCFKSHGTRPEAPFAKAKGLVIRGLFGAPQDEGSGLLKQTLTRSSPLRSNRTCFVFAFSFIPLLLLAIAFSITWLNGFVSEPRHLLIVPLLVIPVLVSYVITSKTIVMKAAALLMFLAPVSRTLFLSDAVTSGEFVPMYASMSPIPGFGKTIKLNGKTLVGPIAWEEPEGGYSQSGAPRWGSSQRPPAGSR